MDNVLKKVANVISSNPKIANRFLKKWGIQSDQIEHKLGDQGLHGGVYSKIKSINNIKRSILQDSKILDIGPETGIEVFLLSEFGADVWVCEPDVDNLKLLKSISKKYVTSAGKVAFRQLHFKRVGFRLTKNKLASEQRNFLSVFKVIKTGLPTYYNIPEDMEKFSNISTKFDIVFVHKVLTTLSRFSTKPIEEIFTEAVKELWPSVAVKGIVSWTEPASLFDIISRISLPGKSKKIEYTIPNVKEKYVQFIIKK